MMEPSVLVRSRRPFDSQAVSPCSHSSKARISGIKVAYLGAQRDLGVTLEIFAGMPDAVPKPMPFDGQ